MSWKTIKHVQDGEPIKESVSARPTKQLEENLNYLKSVIDSLALGSALILREKTLDSNTVVGTPVYDDNGIFRPASASISYDSGTSAFTVDKTSYVIGIVMSKSSSTSGDILIYGNYNVDISSVVDVLQEGPYYLSTDAGKLSSSKLPVTVYVLYYDGSTVFVNPTPREFLEGHVHYRFELYAQPAGTPNCPGFGEAMQIVTPDATQPGWLPASHSSFGGLAPAGAKFGYNLAQHPELSRLFPPFPLESVYIEFNGTSAEDLAVIDMNGIWWMEDCVGYAPWRPWDPALGCNPPTTFPDTLTCDNMPAEILGGVGDPANYIPKIVLWFTKYISSENDIVRSLVPKQNSPIIITNASGASASTGNLEIGIDLALQQEDANEEGYLVFKSTDGSTFKRGPVVETVQAGSSAVVISGSGNTTNGQYGNLTIDIAQGLINGRQDDVVQLILNNAEATLYKGHSVTVLPAGRASSIQATVYIPDTGIDPGSSIRFYFWLLLSDRDALPTLHQSYLLLNQPTLYTSAEMNAKSLATSFTSLPDIDFPNLPIGPDEYILAQSDSIAITAGDLINYKLSRDAADSFDGDIMILRVCYKIFLP